MPIHRGKDKTGSFYQWGQTGKKYYFDPENTSSKTRALNKAKKQQTAIYSSGWKGDERMGMKMKLIKVIKKDAIPEPAPIKFDANSEIAAIISQVQDGISQVSKWEKYLDQDAEQIGMDKKDAAKLEMKIMHLKDLFKSLRQHVVSVKSYATQIGIELK